MHPATTLLVSTDPSLMREVERIHDDCDHIRLEVCGRIAKACTEAQREDVVLIMVHARAAMHDAAVPLLRNAVNGIAKPIVILSQADDPPETRTALQRMGTETVLVLPGEVGQLTAMLQALPQHSTAARDTAGPGVPSRVEELASYLMLPEQEEQMRQVQRVLAQDTTVLLTGETGTGKTLLARRIHELSPRHHEPFLIVDCGALSASLIESEMFGHVKGAFTGADRNRPGKFAAVGRGTLVLDEINSLPAVLQSKLLRVVEERVFEPVGSNQVLPLQARIIAITNVSLEQEVAQGKFRADLYYRLNVVGFNLMALRSCPRAIAPLAAKFFREFNHRAGRDLAGLSPEALDALQGYHWPGNIRQLRNVMERAVALSAGPLIDTPDLPDAVLGCHAAHAALPPNPEGELQRITETLRKHHNNRLRAAAELGISRTSLYKKLRKYRLVNEPIPEPMNVEG